MLDAAPAQAQATRTWVSGVGNDANPCSRTAPCQTFAGAIAKTAAAGEINCLDPGGFGAVTITKAITISCDIGTAGVLVSGTNGIVVAAGPSDQVKLQGLDINGLNTGLSGISFLSGQSLIVDHCNIYEFTVSGINVALSGPGAVLVRDSLIHGMTPASPNGNGIKVSGGSFVALSVERTTIALNNGSGVELAVPSIGIVSESLIYGNNGGAVASAGGAILNVDNTRLTNNNIGASASAAGATIGLSNDFLYANNTAVNAVVGSNFVTGQNNKLSGNGSNGTPPSANMTTE